MADKTDIWVYNAQLQGRISAIQHYAKTNLQNSRDLIYDSLGSLSVKVFNGLGFL